MGLMDQLIEATMLALPKAPPYVVHGACITCPYARRYGNVVVPMSHGDYIHNIDQLTVNDSVGMRNVLTFGVCTSPENPAVQAVAAQIAAKVAAQTKKKKKSFFEKVGDFFCKDKKDEAPDESFVQMCAAPCVPLILGSWDHGKETVELDGSKPLLADATLLCKWGGTITIVDSGQPT